MLLCVSVHLVVHCEASVRACVCWVVFVCPGLCCRFLVGWRGKPLGTWRQLATVSQIDYERSAHPSIQVSNLLSCTIEFCLSFVLFIYYSF